MTTLTMGARTGGFILSEANGYRSRAQIIIGASQTLKVAAVLGAVPNGDPVVTAGTPIGAGNGAIGSWTGDAGVMPGRWSLIITGAAGATASFSVERPDGTLDGIGAVGSAYNGGINGTLADGSTDWATGTRIPFDVSYDEVGVTYVKHDPEGVNGSQFPAAILFDAATTGVGETAKAAAVVRDAEVVQDDLVWDDHTDAEKATAIAQLAALGIICRPAAPSAS